MTREHCQAILRNLRVIKAIASGKPVYFAAFRYDGKFLGWRKSSGVILGSLSCDMYSVKPHIKYNGVREDHVISSEIPPRHLLKVKGGK